VVLTDYPDKALLDNLAYNVNQNVQPPRRAAVHVLGYVWGSSVDPLLAALLQDTATESDADAAAAGPDTSNFDLILLSDLIFNHSQVRPPIIIIVIASLPSFPPHFSSSLGMNE
jgi:nicotinamide N-methyltransferase